jgi:hypothetical protein
MLILFSFHLHANDVDGMSEKFYTSRLDIQKDACEHGNMEGCLQTAISYARLDKDNRNEASMIKYANMACDGGNANGCNLLGLFYLSNETNKNLDLATKYMAKACENKSTFGCGLLGKIFEGGYEDIAVDGVKAVLYYEKACNIGDKNQSVCMLAGLRHHEGKIVPRDYNKAMEYYKKDIAINDNTAGSYLNIFEIDLVNNRAFSVKLINEFKKKFGIQKSAMMYFDMLGIFRLTSQGKKANVSKWQRDYKNQKITDWNFDSLDEWIKENKNEKIKIKLENLRKIFKEEK